MPQSCLRHCQPSAHSAASNGKWSDEKAPHITMSIQSSITPGSALSSSSTLWQSSVPNPGRNVTTVVCLPQCIPRQQATHPWLHTTSRCQRSWKSDVFDNSALPSDGPSWTVGEHRQQDETFTETDLQMKSSIAVSGSFLSSCGFWKFLGYDDECYFNIWDDRLLKQRHRFLIMGMN